MIQFQTGNIYSIGWIGDSELTTLYTVIKRTAKTVTLQRAGQTETIRRKIDFWDDYETCRPTGNYSMAPTLCAKDIVTPEEKPVIEEPTNQQNEVVLSPEVNLSKPSIVGNYVFYPIDLQRIIIYCGGDTIAIAHKHCNELHIAANITIIDACEFESVINQIKKGHHFDLRGMERHYDNLGCTYVEPILHSQFENFISFDKGHKIATA